jgi:hypothetical protein
MCRNVLFAEKSSWFSFLQPALHPHWTHAGTQQLTRTLFFPITSADPPESPPLAPAWAILPSAPACPTQATLPPVVAFTQGIKLAARLPVQNRSPVGTKSTGTDGIGSVLDGKSEKVRRLNAQRLVRAGDGLERPQHRRIFRGVRGRRAAAGPRLRPGTAACGPGGGQRGWRASLRWISVKTPRIWHLRLPFPDSLDLLRLGAFLLCFFLWI